MKRKILFFISFVFLIVLKNADPFVGIDVTVTNNSSETISDIKLMYSGGMRKIASLNSNASRKKHVDPGNESTLEISYINSQGKKFERDLGLYFESDSSGYINIEIFENGEMRFEEESNYELELWFFWKVACLSGLIIWFILFWKYRNRRKSLPQVRLTNNC